MRLAFVLASLAPLAILASSSGRALADASPSVPATPAIVPASTTARPPPTPPASPAAPEHSSHPPDATDIPFEPRSPDYKVALAIEDADLSELVHTVGQLTGKRFVLATTRAKALKATLFAPEKVTVTEAYQAFLSVLQANALTVIPSGAFWKIVDTQDVTKQPTPVTRANETATGEERYVTRVLRLHHVNAEDIGANVLGKFATHDATIVPYAPGNLLILTDTGENIRRMQRILEDVDVAAAGDKVWLEPMNYVSASDIAKKLDEVFDLKSKASAGATPSPDHLTRLVALDRPNALLVVGTQGAYERVLSFLQWLDVPTASEGAIHVVALEHADAKKLAPAINESLQGIAAGSQAPGASKGGLEPLAILDAPVKVSAEETTNSILVTSTEHDFAAVREVIAKLDKPRRQVYIEAVIMEVGIERDTGVGVQWHGLDAVASPLGGGTSAIYGGMDAFRSAAGPNIAGAVSDQQLQALALGIKGPSVNALGMSIPAFGAFIEASTHSMDGDILQTPHILATDNIPAEFHVQVNRSLQQNAQSYASLASLTGATGGAAASSLLGTAPAASNYKAIGPQIKVTPHLNESDDVRLDISETISDTTAVPEGSLGTIPYTERGATTTLTVHDQQTAVIGGLVADKVSHEAVKTPILGDIPLLGALFRHTNDTMSKTDLVLVLTPYILHDQEDMRRIVERRMEERQDLLTHQALFADRPWRAPKSYARARGLLTAIRKSELAAEEERRNAPLPARPPLTHQASAPIDLPAAPVAPPSKPATAQGAPAVKVER